MCDKTPYLFHVDPYYNAVEQEAFCEYSCLTIDYVKAQKRFSLVCFERGNERAEALFCLNVSNGFHL